MWPFSQWTTAGRAALIYTTVGALTVIWTGVWYVHLFNNPPDGSAYYWCTGFLVTGLTMVLIGLVLGKISRSSPADQPAGAVPVAVMLQPTAATAPALNLTAPVGSNGQVVFAPPDDPFAGVTGADRSSAQ